MFLRVVAGSLESSLRHTRLVSAVCLECVLLGESSAQHEAPRLRLSLSVSLPHFRWGFMFLEQRNRHVLGHVCYKLNVVPSFFEILHPYCS